MQYTSKTYSLAALGFLILAIVIFVLGGYVFWGIPTIDIFFALMLLSYVSAFTGLMKSTKSFLSWSVIIVVSIAIIFVIIFISNFGVKG